MLKLFIRNILLLGLAVGGLLPLGRAADTAEADRIFHKLEERRKEAKTTVDWRQLATRCAEFCARFPTHENYLRVLRVEHGALCQVLSSNPPPDDPIHARLAAVEPELLKWYEGQPEQQLALRVLHLELAPPPAALSTAEGRAKRLRNAQQLATEFPRRIEPYAMLLQLAEESPPEWRDKIAQRLAGSASTPEMIKRKAQDLLANPEEVRRRQFAAQLAGTRRLLAEQPKDPRGYQALLTMAQMADPAEGLALARELAALKSPPPGLHEQAVALIRQFEKIGKPLKLKCWVATGETFDMEKLRGKVVVIDFWAVWCKPCIAEMPSLAELYGRKKDQGMEVLGYSLDNNAAAPKEFISLNKLPWPVSCDGNGFSYGFAAECGVTAIPTLWLIDKQGVLRDVNGRIRLEEKVERLLAE